MIRKLTRAEVPDGSVLGILNDIHVPHHDRPAVNLAIECLERAGCTHAILDGDIADSGVVSRHLGKRSRDAIDWGTLKRSLESGHYIYQWAASKRGFLLRGNHEAWAEEKIETDPALVDTVTPEHMMGLPVAGLEVLDSESRLRLGSLVIEHGHGFFPSGSGGQNPGQRIKTLAPNQITIIGHLHRKFAQWWTVQNDDGIHKTYGAYGGGHLSIEASHHSYAGGYPGWQQSFTIVRVWYDGDRPRFTIDQPEIHRDKRGRPVFEYQGHIYR